MPKLNLSDLTFIQRNVVSCGNGGGGIASIPLTVWRHKNGTIHYIPDNPAQLPILKRLMKMELPDVR